MRSSRAVPIRWVVLGVLLLGGAAQAQTAKESRGNVGVLTTFSGSVFLNGKPVTGGSVLAIKDVIETKEGGRCTILLGRDAIVQIGSLSKMELTEIEVEKRRTLLSLSHGTTRALVKTERPGSTLPRREFKVRARAATMGVRGTQIYIDSPMDPNLPQRFSTFEGQAVVELPVAVDLVGADGAVQKTREIPIAEGQGIETLAGAPGRPQAPPAVKVESYQPEQMKKWIDKAGGEISLPPSEQAAKDRSRNGGTPPPPPPPGALGPPPPPPGEALAGAVPGLTPQGPPPFDPVQDSPTGTLRQNRGVRMSISVKRQ